MLLESLKQFDWMNEPANVGLMKTAWWFWPSIELIFGVAPVIIFAKMTVIFSLAMFWVIFVVI